jgi:uncharacterized protein YndB with AHSA1/START domain
LIANPLKEPTMPANTVRLHRIIRAPAERVYRAFVDPAAMCKWLPPHGFTGTVHQLDLKVGGTFRMSFTNLGTGSSHSFGGTFTTLVPGERLEHTDHFDPPMPPADMRTTVTFRRIPFGTALEVVQEGVPEVIPIEACYLGWQESLQLLSLLVEAEIPDAPPA